MTEQTGIRAFLALALPDTVRKRLDDLGGSLRSLGVQASWESSEKLHVTVRFLGTLSPTDIGTVSSEVQRIADSQSPFDLIFTHLGAFPHGNNARVLWAGAHKTDTLMSLMRNLEQACQQAGLEPDQRPPHPHATLGRVKRWHSNTNLTALLKSITFDPILIRTSELTLMKSVLHQRGSTYSTLRSFPFNRPRSSHE